MIVAGKCPPEEEELERAEDRGFEKIELYLEKQHLNEFNRTLDTVNNSELEVVSVHTPHVHLEDRGYVLLADQLVQALDAFLVFHSQYTHHTHIPQLEELPVKSEYGYENNPGASLDYIKNCILDPGHPLVFDTAHYFLAHGHDYTRMERLLKNHSSNIPLIHINDASRVKDGLAFGEGEMNLETTSKIIDSEFDGIMVLEVMPEHQEEARAKFGQYTA